MSTANKIAIFGARTTLFNEFELPEWGGTVRVRPITTGELLDINKKHGTDKGDVPMILACVVDESGKPIFADSDLPDLLKLPFGEIAQVVSQIKEISGLNKSAPKA